MSNSNSLKNNVQIPQKQLLHTVLIDTENLEVDMPTLPEIIYVKSTIVTKSSYAASNIEEGCCTLDLSIPEDKQPSCSQLPFSSNTQTYDIAKPTQKNGSDENKTNDNGSNLNGKKNLVSSQQKVDVSTSTESPNPMRERSIQTEVLFSSASIGIQCDLSNDIEDFTAPEADPEPEMPQNIKEDFLKFVEQNMLQYSESILECCLCGEARKGRTDMEEHMALHWGPSALCVKCGTLLEHEAFLENHHCPKTLHSLKQFKRLIYSPCGSILYSTILTKRKLSAKCRFCKRSHLSVLAKSLYNRKKSLRSISKRKKCGYFCEICLANCKSFPKYKIHRKTCLTKCLTTIKAKRLNITKNIPLLV